MIEESKLRFFIDRINNHRPITADVFLNNFCNNKCPYCRYAHNSGEQMSEENFVKYAKRLRNLGVRGIILSGGGEPTIAKDFDYVAKWLEDNNYDYGVNTNFNKLKLISPIYLKVSLDGYDRESYIKLRGVDSYNIVINNLLSYCEYNEKKGHPTKVGVQCIPTSIEHALSFYDKHKCLNVDYIQFRPIEKTHWQKDEVIATKEMYQSLKKIFVNDPKVHLSFKFEHIYPSSICEAHWASMNIDWDGNVRYCCHKPNDVIGNVMDEDILNKIENYKSTSPCEYPCRLSGCNAFIRKAKQIIPNDINFI